MISIEKIYFNESQKSLSPQFLSDFSLFRFHFVSALQYWGSYCNEYPVKQTSSLHLTLPLKPTFLCGFVVFGMKNTLYLNYLGQILPCKEMKEAFSVKLHPENPCLCLECVPLTISYHLYFLHISKVSSILHRVSVGQVHNKKCYPIFTYTSLFFIKKLLFLSFSFLCLMKYWISATEYWSLRNRNSWYDIVSGTVFQDKNWAKPRLSK